jgi:hypothetical protein
MLESEEAVATVELPPIRLAFDPQVGIEEDRLAARARTEQRRDGRAKVKDEDRRERDLDAREQALNEREAILDERDAIMENEMPEIMDDAATRGFLLSIRRELIAKLLAISRKSPNERSVIQALNRLSDEDRGSKGKDLRPEDDGGPGVIVMEKGTYGV